MTKKHQALVDKLKRLSETHARIERKLVADLNKVAEKIGDLQEIHDQKCAALNASRKARSLEYSKAVNAALNMGLPMGVALAIGAPKSPAANILNN